MNDISFLKSKVKRTKAKLDCIKDQLENYERLLDLAKKKRNKYQKEYREKKKDDVNDG